MEYRVARDELTDGQMTQVQAGKRKLLLLRSGGEYRAFAALCPHYGAPLAEGLLHDDHVLCPWHQSVFDALNGDLIEPPALASLPQFAVRVEDGDVYVEVPDDARRQRAPEMAAPDPDADGRLFAVVGGGATAVAAVAALREAGYQGRIMLISAEDRWPYDRPNLSKDYLAGGLKPEWMALHADSFYERIGVERRHDVVTSLDVGSREILLQGGESLTPDAVLVAPGAEPRRLDLPGADLAGVLTLRSWDDCDRLVAAVDEADHVVVVGASFIGTEVAASLRRKDKDVVVVAPDEVPFAHTLGATVGETLKAAHEQRGTRFRLGRRPVALHGDGTVASVELDDGERLPADVVVMGIGARPRTGFLRGVQVDDDGGVRVDGQLRLAPGVWAGGDIARYPEPHVGEAVRIEHWRLAEQHGRAAAFSMAGAGKPFDGVPFFWTEQAGLLVGFAGVGGPWTDTVVTGDQAAGDFTVFYTRDEQVRAACGTDGRALDAFTELMRTGRVPAASALRATGGDLERYL